MSIFQPLSISSSALTAQRLKLDTISSNIANANTTRGQFVNGQWQPYQRKTVEIGTKQSTPFSQYLEQQLTGVQVNGIAVDQSPARPVYDPTNPDSNAQGYVMMPNVDVTKEMVDLTATSRDYEANVTAFNAGKAMLLKALEIGK